jgi:uncharacterized protein (UPF0264 family)
MTRLLTSVRSVAEARLVVAGGSDWVDVKDPRAGALGAARTTTVRSIVAFVAGRVPVSATIGDVWEEPHLLPIRVGRMADCGVDFVKVGVMAQRVDTATLNALCAVREHAVICVCAAEFPPAADDIAQLAHCGVRGVMLDTFDKTSARLPELLTMSELTDFIDAARAQRLLVGLAGRLRAVDIATLAALDADYLGFRGALCAGGLRTAAIDFDAVCGIRRTLQRGRPNSENTLINEVA